MQKIAMIYPYYDNPTMLHVQVEHWNKYPAAVHKSVHLVIVDDHSAIGAEEAVRNCHLAKSLLRFRDPGLWTQHEARNLGAFYSMRQLKINWLFISDIDLAAPADLINSLLQVKLSPRNYYTFGRVLAPHMTVCRPHCNSFLASAQAFSATNGYDVDLCGLYGGGYGGDDVFIKHLNAHASRCHLDNLKLIGYNKLIEDARTNQWNRAEWRIRYLKVLKRKIATNDMGSANPIRRTWDRIL